VVWGGLGLGDVFDEEGIVFRFFQPLPATSCPPSPSFGEGVAFGNMETFEVSFGCGRTCVYLRRCVNRGSR